MKIINKFILIGTISTSLVSCNETPDNSSHAEATKYARMLKHEVHEKYLSCYPLHSETKKQCVKELNQRYLKKHLSNNEYVESFRYESEKLGFKNFIISQGLPCENIEDGPEYDDANRAYLVKCGNDSNYYMRFDYKANSWSLKNDNDNL